MSLSIFRFFALLHLFVLSKVAYCQVPNSGLITYLPIHYGFSADSGIFNLPVTSYYVTGAKDRFNVENQAIHFFGVNSDIQINISNHTEDFNLQEFSINIWFSAIEDQLTPNPILFKRRNQDGMVCYNLDLSIAGMSVGTNSNDTIISCATNLPNYEQWTMMTMISTSDSIFLYKNAILKASSAKTDTISYKNQFNYISIGSNGGGNSQVFSGFIDDVRMYNRSLNAFEITQLYNEQSSVSIEEKISNSLVIFPNPVNLYFQISNIQYSKIKIYDISGILVMETQSQEKIDISNLPHQLYCLVVESNTGKLYKQLILKE